MTSWLAHHRARVTIQRALRQAPDLLICASLTSRRSAVILLARTLLQVAPALHKFRTPSCKRQPQRVTGESHKTSPTSTSVRHSPSTSTSLRPACRIHLDSVVGIAAIASSDQRNDAVLHTLTSARSRAHPQPRPRPAKMLTIPATVVRIGGIHRRRIGRTLVTIQTGPDTMTLARQLRQHHLPARSGGSAIFFTVNRTLGNGTATRRARNSRGQHNPHACLLYTSPSPRDS